MKAIGEARYEHLIARAEPIDEAELRRLAPLLIVAPHQDDETLGCGGLIATAIRLGLRVRVAYLTDGSASHRGSPSWSPGRIAEVRGAEASAALAILGVPENDILFLGWRDARPFTIGSPEFEDTVARLAHWTAADPPGSLWSTWRGEAHCDHLAAADVAHRLLDVLSPRPAAFSYLVWGWAEEALEQQVNLRSLECRDTIDARRRALACHVTQTTTLIDDASDGFVIPPSIRALADRPSEMFLELA